MTILTRLQSVFVVFFISIHFCVAQKITLIEKNYVYHNVGTGSTTSDWSHLFLIEGESTPRKAGYFGQHLKKALKSDSTAVKFMNSYARRQTFKLVTSVSTIGLFSVFAISNLSKESVSPEHLDEPDKNRGLLFVAAGTFATNLILRIVHPKSIQKAVESHNKNIERKNVGFNSLNFNVQTISGTKSMNVGLKFDL